MKKCLKCGIVELEYKDTKCKHRWFFDTQIKPKLKEEIKCRNQPKKLKE